MKLKPCIRFALALLVWALLFSLKSITAFLLAVILHEGAHLLMCRKLKVRVLGMMLLPWGMTIATPLIYDGKSQFLISSAGPLCNFFILLVCIGFKKIFSVNSEFFDVFMLANFAGGFLNLLPALPLDGGIILKSHLCQVLGLSRGFTVTMHITAILASVITAFGILLFLATGYNFSYAVAGIFIFVNLKHEKELLMCIKKRIFTGEIKSEKKIKYITVDASCHAVCLANLISCAYTLVFLVNENGKFLKEVPQELILKKLFENSLITVGECVEKF